MSLLTQLNRVPPGGVNKTGRNSSGQRAIQTTVQGESQQELFQETDFPDYSQTPFVNVSPTKKQAKFGFKHAFQKAKKISEHLNFPQSTSNKIGRKS